MLCIFSIANLRPLKSDFLCSRFANNNSVWNEIVTSCVDLASYNARDTIRQLEYAGVTYVQGTAAFADSGGSSSLFVTDSDNFITTLNADKILIATGSTPFRPGGIPFDGKRKFLKTYLNLSFSLHAAYI